VAVAQSIIPTESRHEGRLFFVAFGGVWVCGLFCFVVGWGFGVCFVLVGQKNVGWLCVELPVSPARKTR